MDMKRMFAFFLVVFLFTSAVFAADEEDGSFFGRAIDDTLSLFQKIVSPYHRIDPIVITPTRYEDPMLNIAGEVTQLDEEKLTNGGKKYVPDTLRSESGITVSDLLGNGKAVRVDLRGFGDSAPSNVLVLIDGRRTNQIDLSGADWVQIDTGSIKKVEVVRGGQSVLYGDNAAAGVVNIITKDGENMKPSIALDYDFGSYRYSSWKGYAQGGTDFLDYFGMVSTTYNNGYRINNYIETIDYNANITMKPADYFTLRSSAGYHRDWYGQPGALKPADMNSIGRRGSVYPYDAAKTDDYFYMLTPEFKHDFGFGGIVTSGDILFRSRRANSTSYRSYGDSATAHHIRTWGVTPKTAFETEFLGLKNRMIAGFDYYGSRDEVTSGMFSSMNMMVIDKNTAGLYVTDTLEFGIPLILEIGGRAEWAYYKFDQQAILKEKCEKKPFEYACEAGLTYKYNDRSSVYAKYSRSYRFPVTDEWYMALIDYGGGYIDGGLNKSLIPQTANSFEFGIKENSSKYLNIEASYHIMPVRHEIYYDSVTYTNSNYSKTMHSGLDINADLMIFDSIKGFVNYTLQQSYFVGGSYAGRTIPMVPRNQISVGAKYTYKDCLEIMYNVDYVGPRRFANDLQNNMPQLKEYMINNIKFAYRKEGFEVHAAINNIFDVKYSEYGALDFTLTQPGYYPSPGVNATMGVKYSF